MEKHNHLIRCLFWFFVSVWIIVQYIHGGTIPVTLTLCGTGCCSLLYLEKYFENNKKENK